MFRTMPWKGAVLFALLALAGCGDSGEDGDGGVLTPTPVDPSGQWTITATQTGDFFGIPATGRTITFSGMDTLRVSNGKFVEHWGGLADQVDEVAAQLIAP